MTEENKPDKKAWVVLRDVAAEELEGVLNTYATNSYQAFRIDRFIDKIGAGVSVIKYDLILFDPSQIAERQGRALAETMAKLAGLPAFGPAPSSG